MAVGKPLHLRLFLEGVEIPVVAAQVSINLNGPASASIQVIPLDEGMAFKPRTMVHLFFMDQFRSLADAATQDAIAKADDRQSLSKKYPELAKDYKLLFTGEILGFASAKQAMGRSLVLQCLDHSSYWDAVHATAIEYGPQGNAFTHYGALYASNISLFDDIVSHKSEKLVSWILSKPLTPGLQTVSGLAGGIIRMLEAMGGVPGHHKGVNDFFTVAELRCRILEQITAEENDNTSGRLLQAEVFDEWLRNGLQNLGTQVTFRDMMKLLFQYIYYDSVPNPVAKYDPAINQKNATKGVPYKLSQHPTALKAVSDMTSVITGFSRTESFEDDLAVHKDAANYVGVIQSIISNLNSLISSVKKSASVVQKAITELQTAVSTLQGSANDQGLTLRSKLDDASRHIAKASSIITEQGSKETVVSKTNIVTTNSTSRLRTQIIRPDCYFAPAPKCNVIFPEQYSTLNYDRNYLAEVTRSLMMMYNTLVGPDALLATRVLAPNVTDITKELSKATADAGYRALMNHELHTGIIPRVEWMPNISASVKGSNVGDTASKLTGARLSWLNKAALFHFFKYRFSPRQASVSGKFNPYVVCGFPAVIIQKPYVVPGLSQSDNRSDTSTLEYIQTNAKTLGAPSQLVGMVTSVSHSLSQEGGQTQMSMTHCRVHLGVDDEFIGLFATAQDKFKQRLRLTYKYTDVLGDVSKLKRLVAATPQGDAPSTGTVTNVSLQQSTVSYQNTQYQNGQKVTATKTATVTRTSEAQATSPKIPFVNSKGHIDGIDRVLMVPDPAGSIAVGSKGVYGTVAGVEVLDPTTVTIAEGEFAGKRAFSSVAIYEDVPIQADSSIPVEEILRPTWFSSAYSNDNIGKKIYQPFFGTDSIVDELQFIDTNGATSSTNGSDGIDVSLDSTPQNIATIIEQLVNGQNRNSVERAVNLIGYLYGLVKSNGLDVDQFIRAYAERPIATMDQVLGSSDLQIQVQGSSYKVTAGSLGFHSLAINPDLIKAGRLAGLLEDPDLQLPRINNEGKAGPVPPNYDVRSEKLDRVLTYLSALKKGPGFIG